MRVGVGIAGVGGMIQLYLNNNKKEKKNYIYGLIPGLLKLEPLRMGRRYQDF